MLFFFEIMFLILGFCSLGMAIYYGKKNGVIKVFHEVKNLEAMDEVQNSTGDEYGYEDEIYGEVTSADLRKAREDESSELSDREKRRKREENKRKEKKPEIKQEKKKRMFNLNDSEAETDLIRRNILAPRISTIVDDTSEDEETAFMESSSTGKEVYDGEEETGFMGSEEEETSFMSDSNKKNSDSAFWVTDESILGSHGERTSGDGSRFADEDETGFMSSAMNLSQFSEKKKKNARNMETGSAEIPVSENIRSFVEEEDEKETGFMRKEEIVRNPAATNRADDEEETSFMGVSLD